MKSLTEVLYDQNIAEFDQFAEAHFEDGCDECVSAKDAYWHEMAIMAGEDND